VLPSVATNNNAYPLATRPLADGQAATTSLGGGTAAYFTFTVPAGGTATVRTRAGTAAPSNSIRLTLVRVTDQSGAAVTPYEPGQGADLTVANSGGASAQYALVVFNGSSNVTTREAITVTGTGLGGAPLASSAAAVEAAAAAAQAGPTRARLDASAESSPSPTRRSTGSCAPSASASSPRGWPPRAPSTTRGAAPGPSGSRRLGRQRPRGDVRPRRGSRTDDRMTG
jgi:hypothetical protein